MLYHLSEIDELSVLKPRIPINVNGLLENNDIDRVCFAPTIEQCLIGLQINEKDFINDYIDYYVYVSDSKNYISNDIVIKLVFDAHVTNEVWFTNDVLVNKIGFVRCYSYDLLEPRYIEYNFNNKDFCTFLPFYEVFI